MVRVVLYALLGWAVFGVLTAALVAAVIDRADRARRWTGELVDRG